jgi:hypothetical protein
MFRLGFVVGVRGETRLLGLGWAKLKNKIKNWVAKINVFKGIFKNKTKTKNYGGDFKILWPPKPSHGSAPGWGAHSFNLWLF